MRLSIDAWLERKDPRIRLINAETGEVIFRWGPQQVRQLIDAGDIPGNYWAIMTHPYSSDDLIFRMFGDVHMLSHLQGASNRADLKRLKNLESDVVELQEKLKKQRKKHNEQIQKHNEQVQHRDEIIHRQEQELLALMVRCTKKQQQAVIGTSARRDEEYESLIRQTN